MCKMLYSMLSNICSTAREVCWATAMSASRFQRLLYVGVGLGQPLTVLQEQMALMESQSRYIPVVMIEPH